ncbi:hypothetical protein I203_100890 [Kwoniella mangroviensis CBS 8507]|uniref:uncharacterized protein n=1 Tax=Kwoniella mangroviensis CBS 8507 TaxID=1296122 RepID=UPI00080D43CE|nr:uncharacterized protein I203_02530 [Kwoniella mangroviensis CBS 8507]OCF67872.1 hypothetical protein I203_02530 [Kwoniella mangroviensis CBS 8507]
MVSPPSSIGSPELLCSPSSPTISFTEIRDTIPLVPDPKAASAFVATSPRNRTSSPYAGLGHQRSHSETAHLLRPKAFSPSPSNLHPFTEMVYPHSHRHQGYQYNRPSSPLKVGSSHFPVGGSHSHTHVNPHGHSSNRYPPITAAFGSQVSFSASSTPAQSHFPHQAVAPHSPPYDHAGPSNLRRYASQVHRSHVSHRQRAPSGGHDVNLRCSPDCTAAEAPYHLLSTVIGRASVNDIRRTTSKPVKRKAPNDEDIEMEEDARTTNPNGIVNDLTARPNIQTRRSRTRTSSYLGPSSPFSSDSFAKPLTFDRKLLQSTPPLPPVDHLRDPPLEGDFFANYHKSGLGARMTSNAVLLHGVELELEFDLPRSSSAPAIPLLAQRDRGLSDASAASAISADVLGVHSKITTQFPRDEKPHESILPSYVSSPKTISTANHSHGLPPTTSRFSTFSGARRLDLGEKLGSLGQIVGDANELTSYLGEDLAAALKQRLQPEQSEMVKEIKRKEEVLSEAEWSFDVPLAKALGDVVRGWVKGVEDKEHLQVVEYGCHKETPNAVLAETVRTLALRSVGPGRPKKVLTVTHQCSPDFDTRSLQANLSNHPQSYRKIKAIPSPLILTSYSFAGFAEPSLPPNSVDVALCTNELSKLHGTIQPKPLYLFTSQAEEREQRSEKDLSGWLKLRAKEVRPGGILACSFAVRTAPSPEHNNNRRNDRPGNSSGQEGFVNPPRGSPGNYSMSLPTSPRTSNDEHVPNNMNITPMTEINNSPFVPGPPLPSPPMTNGKTRKYRPDIWQAMSHALSPAIQRLVSLGEIKTQVAPLLVDVPYWPRTLESIQNTLSKTYNEWEPLTDHSSGEALGASEEMKRSFSDDSDEFRPNEYSPEEKKEWEDSGIKIFRLTHPAWIDYRKGKIDRSGYAKRIATYCRSVYEGHLKKVLRERGRMDISQCETTVQELFKVLVEKCELGALDALEIDVGIIVLRRK